MIAVLNGIERSSRRNSVKRNKPKQSNSLRSIYSLDGSDLEQPTTEAPAEDDFVTEKWNNLSLGLIKRARDSECGIAILPSSARKLYYDIEIKYGIKINKEKRKLYYRKFFSKLSGSAALAASEVEHLLGPSELGLVQTLEEARSEIQQLIAKYNTSLEVGTEVEYDEKQLDFEFFVSLICEIQCNTSKSTESDSNAPSSVLSRRIPIDPDSSAKQCWDIFCLLLLLYCSFSVPYGIAFLDSDNSVSLSTLDMFGLGVDLVFMIDIGCSFVTSIEVDGIVVRDLRIISLFYFRSQSSSFLYMYVCMYVWIEMHGERKSPSTVHWCRNDPRYNICTVGYLYRAARP